MLISGIFVIVFPFLDNAGPPVSVQTRAQWGRLCQCGNCSLPAPFVEQRRPDSGESCCAGSESVLRGGLMKLIKAFSLDPVNARRLRLQLTCNINTQPSSSLLLESIRASPPPLPLTRLLPPSVIIPVIISSFDVRLLSPLWLMLLVLSQSLLCLWKASCLLLFSVL